MASAEADLAARIEEERAETEIVLARERDLSTEERARDAAFNIDIAIRKVVDLDGFDDRIVVVLRQMVQVLREIQANAAERIDARDDIERAA